MISEKSLVIYKNQCAVVLSSENDKYLIRYCSVPATSTGKKAQYTEVKVRDKDIILLHKGPASSLDAVLSFKNDDFETQIKDVYELLISDENTAKSAVSIDEIADLAKGSFNADESWFVYSILINSYEFSLVQDKKDAVYFIPESAEKIEEQKKKDYEKEHEAEIHAAFLERLKNRKLESGDSKYMGEVEAYALCKTDKSKIMQEIGLSQSIEKAHKLLIETGIWDITKNPYPTRFGFSFDSAKEGLSSMPEEERVFVPGFCYAIDSEYSTDPDDAVAFDGEYLWVHIADPASSVMPGSSIDIAARNRGTTLYIPEGASRMLCEDCLEDYALGLKEESSALSFRLKLNDDCSIDDCSVFKTKIKVKRLSYKKADELKESTELKPLFEIARKNVEKRQKNHSVTITMPEVHIDVDKNTKKVTISPDVHYESNSMICEMMLLAGEGAAKFAFKNQIPFPFVSQESSEIPKTLPEGYAGQFALIKCMRKRSVGITPAPHFGLGLSFYSQVTSPLRRYGDLIAHQQLRAFLDGRKILQKDEMLERISAGDAASLAARKASRLSEMHWKLIYLLQNPDLIFEAVCIDIKGSDVVLLIPDLDMQTMMKNFNDMKLNDSINIKACNIDIPTQKVEFSPIA